MILGNGSLNFGDKSKKIKKLKALIKHIKLSKKLGKFDNIHYSITLKTQLNLIYLLFIFKIFYFRWHRYFNYSIL